MTETKTKPKAKKTESESKPKPKVKPDAKAKKTESKPKPKAKSGGGLASDSVCRQASFENMSSIQSNKVGGNSSKYAEYRLNHHQSAGGLSQVQPPRQVAATGSGWLNYSSFGEPGVITPLGANEIRFPSYYLNYSPLLSGAGSTGWANPETPKPTPESKKAAMKKTKSKSKTTNKKAAAQKKPKQKKV